MLIGSQNTNYTTAGLRAYAANLGGLKSTEVGHGSPTHLAPKGDRVEFSGPVETCKPHSSAPSGHGSGGWRKLKTALWCSLAVLPIAVGAALHASDGPTVKPPVPVSVPVPVPVSVTVTNPALPVSPSSTSTTTNAPTVITVAIPEMGSTDPTTVVTVAPPTSAVPAPPVLETPVVTEAPGPVSTPAEVSPAWDWHEHFSPYDLAQHQLYSNDCGVTAAQALLRSNGYDADHDTLFDDAISGGFHSGRGPHKGWNGPYKMVDYLETFGMDAHMEAFNHQNVDAHLAEGRPFIVSTERHYFVISGQDERGQLIAGATGDVVGMGDTVTYNELANFGGAHRIIVVDNVGGEVRAPAFHL